MLKHVFFNFIFHLQCNMLHVTRFETWVNIEKEGKSCIVLETLNNRPNMKRRRMNIVYSLAETISANEFCNLKLFTMHWFIVSKMYFIPFLTILYVSNKVRFSVVTSENIRFISYHFSGNIIIISCIYSWVHSYTVFPSHFCM